MADGASSPTAAPPAAKRPRVEAWSVRSNFWRRLCIWYVITWRAPVKFLHTPALSPAGTDLEGGLIAPSLKMMSDGLHLAVARGEEMAMDEAAVQGVLAFAAKCAKGAAFDKVRNGVWRVSASC